jgi:Amino acid synthesis
LQRVQSDRDEAGRARRLNAAIIAVVEKSLKLKLRKILTFAEEVSSEAGQAGDPPLRKAAVIAVVENPFAGRRLVAAHRCEP